MLIVMASREMSSIWSREWCAAGLAERMAIPWSTSVRCRGRIEGKPQMEIGAEIPDFQVHSVASQAARQQTISCPATRNFLFRVITPTILHPQRVHGSAVNHVTPPRHRPPIFANPITYYGMKHQTPSRPTSPSQQTPECQARTPQRENKEDPADNTAEPESFSPSSTEETSRHPRAPCLDPFPQPQPPRILHSTRPSPRRTETLPTELPGPAER